MIIRILFLVVFTTSNLSLLSGQSTSKLKVNKSEEYIYIAKNCNNGQVNDTIDLNSYKDYDFKVVQKNTFYFLWASKMSFSKTNTTYFLNKQTLNSKCEFEYQDAHWCKQEFFDKKLKKGRYIKFTKKGIVILFSDGSKRSITFEELEKEKMQEILKKPSN